MLCGVLRNSVESVRFVLLHMGETWETEAILWFNVLFGFARVGSCVLLCGCEDSCAASEYTIRPVSATVR